jgi:hypothetical protein
MRLSLRLAKISMEGEVATKLECSSTASWKLNLSKGVLGFLTRVGNLLILRVMTYCVVGAIAVLAGASSSQAQRSRNRSTRAQTRSHRARKTSVSAPLHESRAQRIEERASIGQNSDE